MKLCGIKRKLKKFPGSALFWCSAWQDFKGLHCLLISVSFVNEFHSLMKYCSCKETVLILFVLASNSLNSFISINVTDTKWNESIWSSQLFKMVCRNSKRNSKSNEHIMELSSRTSKSFHTYSNYVPLVFKYHS